VKDQTPAFPRRLFWFAWIAAACLFGVMAGFAAVTDYFPGDLSLARQIQDLNDVGFGPVAAFVHAAGASLWSVLITLAFAGAFLVRGRPWEPALLVTTFVPRGLRQLLATIVARPRPSADLLQIRDHASGYSFPSGHATGAMVLYGALFVFAGLLIPHRTARLLFQALCLFMIVATGTARVYAGVHWPSDVIGGYLFGLLALAPLFFLYRLAATRLNTESLSWSRLLRGP
jgi:membrane-associated phospholipid phosphatase